MQLRERHDRPLRPRARRGAPRLATRRPAPRGLTEPRDAGARRRSAVIASPDGHPRRGRGAGPGRHRPRRARQRAPRARSGSAAASSGCARSTRRRRRRSTSTPSSGVYHCFGCQASGDAITFVREVEHLDFVDAVERLAARAGITLRYDDNARRQGPARASSGLSEAVGAAIDFYHELLLEAPTTAGSRAGTCASAASTATRCASSSSGGRPTTWDRLSVHLQKQKFARDDIVGAGLAFVNKVEQAAGPVPGPADVPDLRRARRRRRASAAARSTSDGPKYKNSPETPIYQKSRLLYGLNWAKGEIVGRGEVVICEGYTDVMAFALAGAPERGRHVRHRAGRRPLPDPQEPRPQGGARLRRRRRRPGRGGEVVRVGAALRDPARGRRPARRAGIPADVWHDDPQRCCRRSSGATPFLQFRLDRVLARGRPRHPRGPGAGRRGRRRDRRASTRTSWCATSTS